VLVSRDYEDDHFVQLDFPAGLNFKPEGKMLSINGVDFNTKNAVVDSTEILIADEMVVKVPKHGMIFIRFETDSIKMTNLPLAHYIYPGMEELSIYAPKNTFTKANERLAFRAYINPAQSWDNVVVWSLLNNSGNYSFDVTGTYCYVNSGNFVGNETDSLILKASNRTGDVFDEVVLYLPQIPVSADVLESNSGFKIYPNPAIEILNVELDFNDTIRIYAASGIKVFEKKLVKGRNEIRLNQFAKGMYTLQIGNRTEKLLLTN
jgi:hypothetical protein